MTSPQENLQALRNWMQRHDIAAYYVPISDPHADEYVPEHWQCLRHLTGFTGSAATVIVTPSEALLWTDSRYYLQAATELQGTGFSLMRDGQPDVPSPFAWCKEHLPSGKPLTVPADMVSVATAREAEAEGVVISAPLNIDPFSELWPDRPAKPTGTVKVQSAQWTGHTVGEKLHTLRHIIDQEPAERQTFLFSSLPDIAWLLNLRGSDIACNPLLLAYLTYSRTSDTFTLFTHHESFTAEALKQMQEAGVGLASYESIDLKAITPAAGTVCFDATTTPLSVAPANGTPYASPIEPLRARKTEAEIAGMREAMERDGVALVQFLRWMDEQKAAHTLPTELSLDEKLTKLRAAQQGFDGLSFDTIAAYGAHGAIVHYEASAETNAQLQPHSFLLLDSGAQYDCGTTDITRTLPLGELTDEERLVYTLVLKGHLALQRQHFPEFTTGLQLDLAARQYMWNAGYDFGHGTGHGVGAHLSVHEGPHQIRKNVRPCTLLPLEEGMTITDEPGIYVEGHFGVRIENTLIVQPDRDTPFGHFMQFEPLTLCPYQLEPVITTMLTSTEREQINHYHATVLARLLPRLTDEADRQWLTKACQSI